jgi:hypothetical protein
MKLLVMKFSPLPSYLVPLKVFSSKMLKQFSSKICPYDLKCMLPCHILPT